MVKTLIVAGQPFRRIAPQFGVSDRSLRRHAEKHLPADLAKSKKTKDLARADTLGKKIDILIHEATDILLQAREEMTHGPWQKRSSFAKIALQALRDLGGFMAMLERVSEGATEASYLKGFLDSTEFVELQAIILKAVKHEPGLRQQTLQAFEQLSGENGDGKSEAGTRPGTLRRESGIYGG